MENNGSKTTNEDAGEPENENLPPTTAATLSLSPLADAHQKPQNLIRLVVSSSIGLSIAERGLEIQHLLGFHPEILTYRLDETSRRMYTRDIYAYLEFAQTPELALRPATLARWINHLVK